MKPSRWLTSIRAILWSSRFDCGGGPEWEAFIAAHRDGLRQEWIEQNPPADGSGWTAYADAADQG